MNEESAMVREYKPTVVEMTSAVFALYARHDAGCCLHIVLDDENCENVFVEQCIEFAIEAGHRDCEVLARALRSMSKTQRRVLARRDHR